MNIYADENNELEAVVRTTKDDYRAAEEARSFAFFLLHSATNPEDPSETFTLEFDSEGAILLASSIIRLASEQIPTGDA